MKKAKTMKSEIIPKGVKIVIVNQGRSFLVLVEGAKRVLLCMPSRVRVLLKGRILCLSGQGLLCTTYASGAIEIAGELSEIKFECSHADEKEEG